jgi:glycine hydroxymethyltransferase
MIASLCPLDELSLVHDRPRWGRGTVVASRMVRRADPEEGSRDPWDNGRRSPRPQPQEVLAVSQATVSSAAWASIAEVDPELWDAMEAERHRQTDKIELIASENYVFAPVLEAQGSWLTNKYAEGLPGRRYYGGCEHVDIAENLARARALALFPGSEHVNVQPHSGAQANMAAYFAVLRPGDRILGMSLAHGGHLTHGSPVNFSGRLYEVHAYGVDRETERIDYDVVARQAEDVRPRVLVAGASAYPRTWDFERLAAIAHGVGALLFVDMAHFAGLVAAGLHPSPFPHADLVTTTTHKTLRGPRGGLVFARSDLPGGLDRADFPALGKGTLAQAIDKSVFPGVQGGPLMHVIAAKAVALLLADTDEFRADQAHTVENADVLARTVAEAGARLVSGGTDNHLALVDVTPLGVTGREAEALLDDVGITVNKNAIPYDANPPNIGSGIRIGTPATTTRGMRADEMRVIGHLVVDALRRREDAAAHARIRDEVRALVARFPVPGLPRDRA